MIALFSAVVGSLVRESVEDLNPDGKSVNLFQDQGLATHQHEDISQRRDNDVIDKRIAESLRVSKVRAKVAHRNIL